MTVDLSAWRITPTHDTEPLPIGRRSIGSLASAALRTTGLLVLATLAILVLLPAMIAAQPTFLG